MERYLRFVSMPPSDFLNQILIVTNEIINAPKLKSNATTWIWECSLIACVSDNIHTFNTRLIVLKCILNAKANKSLKNLQLHITTNGYAI